MGTKSSDILFDAALEAHYDDDGISSDDSAVAAVRQSAPLPAKQGSLKKEITLRAMKVMKVMKVMKAKSPKKAMKATGAMEPEAKELCLNLKCAAGSIKITRVRPLCDQLGSHLDGFDLGDVGCSHLLRNVIRDRLMVL